MPKQSHGLSGYTKRGCRCEVCRAARAAYLKGYRERNEENPLPEDDPRHGKRSTYVMRGCRCDKCRAASLAYWHSQQDRKRRGDTQ